MAAGIIGLAAGAILGSTLSKPQRPEYIGPPRPQISYEPWTPEWYRYCRAKYRSFNPDTGYYIAYSGQYRFCE
ncbi:BA14K family protein [Hongsoonwoonella zoysiae]|uniref:BA14K family protein n=1 Tax=Hongsoonwoonella zoysiae TaxID=2821844 RepID=UPI001FE962BA|nr:BA14K family protein [Hongsoonwoonella zoysiae]